MTHSSNNYSHHGSSDIRGRHFTRDSAQNDRTPDSSRSRSRGHGNLARSQSRGHMSRGSGAPTARPLAVGTCGVCNRYPVYGEWRKDPDTGADYFICEGCIDD